MHALVFDNAHCSVGDLDPYIYIYLHIAFLIFTLLYERFQLEGYFNIQQSRDVLGYLFLHFIPLSLPKTKRERETLVNVLDFTVHSSHSVYQCQYVMVDRSLQNPKDQLILISLLILCTQRERERAMKLLCHSQLQVTKFHFSLRISG